MRRWNQRLQPAILFLAGLWLWNGCDRNVRNLGGGFTIVHQPAEASVSSSHAHHLYFGSKDLGSVGQYFISPSTCHALFDHEGKLMLFHSCSETLKTVGELNENSRAQVTWSETRSEAKVTWAGSTNIIVVPLSACACRVENRSLSKVGH